MGSFFTALSGLTAETNALDVVGNNLANINTQGFQENNVTFEDAMNEASATLQVGGGVGSTITSRDFAQGNIENTSQPLDMAIQGNGFFVVQDPSSGQTLYTRDGTFNLNSQGQLVTASGDLVQGWMAANGTVNPSGATSGITVPLLSSLPPSATQNMSVAANLNASAAVGDTFSAPVQVYDSLGNVHTLSVQFTNTAPGAWNYSVNIPSADVTGGTGTTTSLAKGTVSFSSSGVLTTPAAGAPVSITSPALADGAAALQLNWNLYSASGTPNLSGYAESSAVSGTTQDGAAAGTVTGISLQNGGDLVATYSNGSQSTLAQVAVAGIANPDTLVGTSGNNYQVGLQTITPAVGAAGTGGRGNLISQSLEESNVNMAAQFTDLIVYQQGYDANSKVISTVNQMEQTLLAINP